MGHYVFILSIFLALVFGFQSTHRGQNPHTKTSVYESFAEGMLVHQRLTRQALQDDPSSTGTMAIIYPAPWSNTSYSSCTDGTNYATWMADGRINSGLFLPVLRNLASEKYSVGISNSTTITTTNGNLVNLPCLVPVGLPVIATIVN